MPEIIDVPKLYRPQWQFKIYDNEEIEPPHVTILGPGGNEWRWGLRERAFMPSKPPPFDRDVPKELVRQLKETWLECSYKWNKLHPENPVQLTDEQVGEYFLAIGMAVSEIPKQVSDYKLRIEKHRIFKK